jgi:serine protease
MGRFRARTLCATSIAAAAALVLAVKAQSPSPQVQTLRIENVGLPAVEETFVLRNDARAPGSPAELRRAVRAAAEPLTRVSSSGRSYTAGRVIVRFRDDVGAADRQAAASLASGSAELDPRRSYTDFDVVRIDASEDAEAVAASLRGRPNVEYAQAAYRVHPTFVPNDPLYKELQWNLPLLNLERAWDIQPTAGSAITVAVLDGGMAYRAATLSVNIRAFRNEGVLYPALGNVTIPYSAAPQLVGAGNTGRIVAPFDVISGGLNSPLDFEGHGTHVSGTIGQLTNDGIGVAGVAFNVKLMPVKVLGGFWDVVFGSALFEGGSDDDVARGIRYAADNGAKVINMSLGSSGPPDCGANPNKSGCAPVVEAAMRYAVGKGSFIVVAGGNEFEDVDPQFGANATSVIAEIASRINGAISVAAVDPAKNRAYYSTTGSYIEIAAPGGTSRGFGRNGFVFQQTFDFQVTDTFDPSVVAPSDYRAPRFDVFSTIGLTGTSMAAPHVSGIAAMLMQQGITDPAAIEEALEKSAVDIGAPGRDNDFGFGLIDARAALRGLGLAK